MNQKEKTECMGFDGMQKMNGAINADLMTVEEIHQKLEAGYKDMERGRVREASEALQNFDRDMKSDKGERGRACRLSSRYPKKYCTIQSKQ